MGAVSGSLFRETLCPRGNLGWRAGDDSHCHLPEGILGHCENAAEWEFVTHGWVQCED
jgi:hypothetical protein